MKIDYKTSMFIIVIVALLATLTCARYLALENNKISDELIAVQSEFNLINDELNTTKNELRTTQEDLKIEIDKSIELDELLRATIYELEVANATITDLKSDEYELMYVGDYKITYYCDERYQHICGGNGVTASGKPTEVWVTAAADWSVLPKGSIIYIQGVGFREIQDVGGGVDGNHIDVLVETHNEALALGTHSSGVWILVKKNS